MSLSSDDKRSNTWIAALRCCAMLVGWEEHRAHSRVLGYIMRLKVHERYWQ